MTRHAVADPAGQTAPDLDAFEAIAVAALDRLPPGLAPHARRLLIRVADWPDEETLDEMGIEDPYELTGLYRGVPLTEKSLDDLPGAPDEVWLYRRPILDEWAERGDVALGDLVVHVLIHEIAHHFGWSDEAIARIDDWRL